MPIDSLIRAELKKLKDMPPWGRAQGDRWDKLSNFIYRIKTLQGVQRQAQAIAQAQKLDATAFGAYAVRRWFNHHSHDEILQMFYAHPTVQPETDRKHRTIDFYLRDLPFDLKISRFPQAYPESLAYAQQQPSHLALWLYENQSKQGRYHIGHRLFLILHNVTLPSLTWRRRCEFDILEQLIQEFLEAPPLFGLTLRNYHTGETYHPWSAVIFHVK